MLRVEPDNSLAQRYLSAFSRILGDGNESDDSDSGDSGSSSDSSDEDSEAGVEAPSLHLGSAAEGKK